MMIASRIVPLSVAGRLGTEQETQRHREGAGEREKERIHENLEIQAQAARRIALITISNRASLPRPLCLCVSCSVLSIPIRYASPVALRPWRSQMLAQSAQTSSGIR